jgi:hypothetical protein
MNFTVYIRRILRCVLASGYTHETRVELVVLQVESTTGAAQCHLPWACVELVLREPKLSPRFAVAAGKSKHQQVVRRTAQQREETDEVEEELERRGNRKTV